jgi:hypothetical protein
MWLYVNVRDREISTPKSFNTKLDAQRAMLKDFVQAIGDDTVAELKESSIDLTNIDAVDLTDVNIDTYDLGINAETAYANDAFGGNHSDWDGKIFEI